MQEVAPRTTRTETFLHKTWQAWPSRSASIAVVFARAVPLLFLPVMVLTVVAVLEARPVLGVLIWVCPIALVGASLWTRAWLHSTIGAVLVRGDIVAVQTFSELGRNEPAVWKRLTDVALDGETLTATIGREPYQFRSTHWPRLEAMADALTRAREAARST
jgi:hypothetical protein